jgi:hypothetical protein
MFSDLGWQECESLLVLVMNVSTLSLTSAQSYDCEPGSCFLQIGLMSSHLFASLPGRCHYLQKQQVSVCRASGTFDLRCTGFIWNQNFSHDRHSKGNAGLLQIQPGMLCPKPYCSWDSVVSIESTLWILKKWDGMA